MKTYTLFWLTGKSEIVNGDNITSAVNNAGYSGGAIRALDFWTEGDKTRSYSWNKLKRNWEPC